MPKFDVNFDIRLYNGTITIEAKTAEEAEEIVERMNVSRLTAFTNDVYVEVESAQEVVSDKS